MNKKFLLVVNLYMSDIQLLGQLMPWTQNLTYSHEHIRKYFGRVLRYNPKSLPHYWKTKLNKPGNVCHRQNFYNLKCWDISFNKSWNFSAERTTAIKYINSMGSYLQFQLMLLENFVGRGNISVKTKFVLTLYKKYKFCDRKTCKMRI